MLSWWPNNSAYYLYNHPILNACTLTPIYGGVVVVRRTRIHCAACAYLLINILYIIMNIMICSIVWVGY